MPGTGIYKVKEIVTSKLSFRTLIAVIIFLLLVCAAAAMALACQDPEPVLLNGPVISFVEKSIGNFTGAPVDAARSITRMKTWVGDVYQVSTESGEIYNINTQSGMVETALTEKGLDPAVRGMNLSGMQEVALDYAEKHYPGFAAKKMTLAESKIIDHGSMGKEYVFYWNAMSGEAYTLSYVAISIYPDDAMLAYHASDRELLINTTPNITRAEAGQAAERAFGMGPGAETTSRLMVEPDGNGQRLVWLVETIEHDERGFAHGGSVMVDAITGAVGTQNPVL